jgi:preprotein translocase subunit SecA
MSPGDWLKRIFGSRNERVIKGMLPIVERVNALEPEYDRLSDDELRAKTAEFKGRLANGETLDDLLPEAFAAVRTAAARTLGLRLYDVQVLGGVALHRNSITEMMTGEGKTLTSVAAAYLNSLTGRGVHIITVNDYLAKRDAAWNGPVYEALDLTVGCIQAQMHSDERVPQYEADITYGTNSEFGFDYLRDNMKARLQDQCQRDRHYAIIDEVDSILIDEARTPLIISGPAEDSSDKYYKADRVVRRWAQGRKGIEKADLDDKVFERAKAPGPEREEMRLQIEGDYHFVYSETGHTAYLTETGIVAAQRELGIPDFYAPEVMNENWPHHLEQAVRAHCLYKREKEYVVKDGEVIIVDEFTGRLMEGRRWSDGLHQAVEAREGIKIRAENQTLATVTIQNFFRLYDKLAGMTGTALTEAAEFHKIYKLDVTTVPTNRPLNRKSYDDRIYLTEKEKWRAVVDEVREVHRTGRPILVGTTSIEANEKLSAMLVKRGVPHEVLNAKQHEREAAIIAKAGQLGAVTIATNMAGRGTDILLGSFSREELVQHWQEAGLAARSLDPRDPELYAKLTDHWLETQIPKDSKLRKHLQNGDPAAKRKALNDYWEVHGLPKLPFEDVGSVAAMGGLHIIGTERHEARRIDNQLRGRSGRQGDPGSSVFFVALEDPLMRKFARDWVKRMLGRLGMGEGQEITSPMVSKAIERAQKKVEEHNFDIRKNLLEYDKVNDEQRKAIYERRTAILRSEQLEETAWELLDLLLGAEVGTHFPGHVAPEDWRPGEVVAWARRKFLIELDGEELRKSGSAEAAAAIVRRAIAAKMEETKEGMGEDDFHRTLRFILLQSFDDKWKEHLRELDAMRQAVGLRGYAQQDPKLEYRREGSQMFQEMQVHIAEAVTDVLLKVHVTEEMDDMAGGRWRPAQLSHAEVTAFETEADTAPIGSTAEKLEPIRRETPKVGRNEPCPCGSGKKYKKCCGRAG